MACTGIDGVALRVRRGERGTAIEGHSPLGLIWWLFPFIHFSVSSSSSHCASVYRVPSVSGLRWGCLLLVKHLLYKLNESSGSYKEQWSQCREGIKIYSLLNIILFSMGSYLAHIALSYLAFSSAFHGSCLSVLHDEKQSQAVCICLHPGVGVLLACRTTLEPNVLGGGLLEASMLKPSMLQWYLWYYFYNIMWGSWPDVEDLHLTVRISKSFAGFCVPTDVDFEQQ